MLRWSVHILFRSPQKSKATQLNVFLLNANETHLENMSVIDTINPLKNIVSLITITTVMIYYSYIIVI